MITSVPSFKANQLNSARDLYDAKLVKNEQTAQSQTNKTANMANENSLTYNSTKAAITMQGTGQKLDVMA